MTPLDILVPNFFAILLKQAGLSRLWNTVIVVLIYLAWTAFSVYSGLRLDLNGQPIPVDPWTFASSFVLAFATGYAAYTVLWKNIFNEEQLSIRTSVIKGPETEEIDPAAEDEEVAPTDEVPQG